MANQPKKYKKFVATAATATLVASAIVPVASADELVFSDMAGYDADTIALVEDLAEQGIIKGSNGKFNPQGEVTRKHAVLIIGRYLETLGFKAGEGVKQFDDVKGSDAEFARLALLVRDLGIFNGNDLGQLNPDGKFTRQNMALVIDRVFELTTGKTLKEIADEQGKKGNVADINKVKKEAKNAVLGANALGLSKVATFNPEGAAKRVHFAQFFYVAAPLIAENLDPETEKPEVGKALSVKAINATTVEVTFKDAVEDVKALDFEIDGLKIENAAIKQSDDKVVVLTTSKQDGGKEYTVKNAGDKIGSFKGISAVTPTSIKFTTNSNSLKVGTEYTLKADIGVKEAGVPVTFNIDAPTGSLNKDYIVEAYTNADGIAEYSYTQYSAGVDTVSVYPTGAPTVRAIANVYWGVQDILTIVPTTKDTTIANGTVKTYKVKLANPTTGVAVANANVQVLFEENIAQVNGTSASATNVNGGTSVTPFQRATGTANLLTLTTNSDGEAEFTVTGSNTAATPIVFIDTATLVNGNVLPNGIGGNANTRLDATELQVRAEKLTFQGAQIGHKITITPDTVAAVAADAGAATAARGRVYTIEVKKPDGTAFAGGVVNIGLNELLDGNITTTTNAFIPWTDNDNSLRTSTTASNANGVTPTLNANQQQVAIQLNSQGKATFQVSNATAGQTATPIVWIDQDTVPNNRLDTSEPQQIAASTIFEARAINNLNLESSVSTQVVGQAITYTATVRDQNNAAYTGNPTEAVRVTYTFTNEGQNTVTISNPTGFTGNTFSVNGASDTGFATQTINPGQSITIAGTLPAGTTAGSFQVTGAGAVVGTNSAQVKVSANARTLTTNKFLTANETTGKWVNAQSVNTLIADGTSLTGKVVAFNTEDADYANAGAANRQGGQVIVEVDGQPGVYAWFPYTATTTGTSTADNFRVGADSTHTANTPTTAAQFERAISVGDKVRFTDAGGAGVNAQANADTVDLYNADNSDDASQVKVTAPAAVGGTGNITSVSAIDNAANNNGTVDSLLVTFDKNVRDGALPATGAGITIAGATVTGAVAFGNANDGTIRLTFAAPVNPATLGNLSIGAGLIAFTDNTFNAAVSSTVTEGIVPTVLSAQSYDTNNDGRLDRVRVLFSENVEESTVSTAGFTFTNGIPVNGVDSTRSTATDNVVWLTLDTTNPAANVVGTGALGDIVVAQNAIRDISGNGIAALAGGNITVADLASPVLLGVDSNSADATLSNGETLTATFSENINDGVTDMTAATVADVLNRLQFSNDNFTTVFTAAQLGTTVAAESAAGAGNNSNQLVITFTTATGTQVAFGTTKVRVNATGAAGTVQFVDTASNTALQPIIGVVITQ